MVFKSNETGERFFHTLKIYELTGFAREITPADKQLLRHAFMLFNVSAPEKMNRDIMT